MTRESKPMELERKNVFTISKKKMFLPSQRETLILGRYARRRSAKKRQKLLS